MLETMGPPRFSVHFFRPPLAFLRLGRKPPINVKARPLEGPFRAPKEHVQEKERAKGVGWGDAFLWAFLDAGIDVVLCLLLGGGSLVGLWWFWKPRVVRMAAELERDLQWRNRDLGTYGYMAMHGMPKHRWTAMSLRQNHLAEVEAVEAARATAAAIHGR